MTPTRTPATWQIVPLSTSRQTASWRAAAGKTTCQTPFCRLKENHAAKFQHLHELTGSNIAFVILKHRWAGPAHDLSLNRWAS
jgi:hypothetical protein